MTLCERNQQVNNGFPSQKARNEESFHVIMMSDILNKISGQSFGHRSIYYEYDIV